MFSGNGLRDFHFVFCSHVPVGFTELVNLEMLRIPEKWLASINLNSAAGCPLNTPGGSKGGIGGLKDP